MDKEKLAAALHELTRTGQRSQTAKLRDIFEDVEAALKSGVTRESIHKTLKEQGFTFTFRAFEQAMYRIRKSGKQPAKVTPHISADAVPEPPRTSDRDEKFQHYARQSNPLTKRKSK